MIRNHNLLGGWDKFIKEDLLIVRCTIMGKTFTKPKIVLTETMGISRDLKALVGTRKFGV